jgi:predicted aspartyl protease/tetratricopeptide (TPR) repeat protein
LKSFDDTARRLAAGMLLGLALQVPTASQAGCKLKAIDIPVKIVGRRAVATVDINGTPVPLFVDSGAFFSMLNEAAAQQLQLPTHSLPGGMRIEGLTGNIPARMTTVRKLGLANGELPSVDFVVGGNADGGTGSMGLLGRNLLSVADTEYDFAHGMVRIVVPGSDCDDTVMAYWAGDTPISMVELIDDGRERRPQIRAKMQLNGHKFTAMFDTGAQTLVSLSAAHSAGVKDADMKPSGRVYGGGDGRANAWTASFDRVELGGETVMHNRLDVADFDLYGSDLLVGFDFFLSHHIYVSAQQGRMYFTYNGGPVFALNASAPPSAAASGADDGLDADALARRGSASLARHDARAALADLDRAVALAPGNAGFLATRAGIHAELHDGPGESADLDAALRLDPGQDNARFERARLRQAAGQRDAALDDLAALDKSLPAQSSLRFNMAAAYDSVDLPAQAVAQWTLWIAAHRHDYMLERAWNGRCWARVRLGAELDAALEDCDNAVDADGKNADYRDSRGWVYVRQGKLQKAIADFDRGLAVEPRGAWSLYGRGLARLRQGDKAGQADLDAARKAQADIDARVRRAGLPTAPDAAP